MSVAELAERGCTRPTLAAADFRRLREFLYDRSGLYFADNKHFLLESRVLKRLRVIGMGTMAEYVSLVTSPSRGHEELLALLDVVTTHETSFFRNPTQLDAFRRVVLPYLCRVKERRGGRSLRIWSAACASGEEAYTLAMLVLEHLGPDLSGWQVSVLGTDLARSVLEQGRQALYGSHSFRNITAYYKQKYFECAGPETFRVRDEVRALVDLQLVNFADDARMRALRGFDLVFCRNALIYFDRRAKRRFVAHFARALEPGGYLFVGHAESLHGVSDAFRLIHLPGALAYQKPALDADGSPPWKATE